MLFKVILSIVAISAYTVNAVPAFHRTNEFTLNNYKSLDHLEIVDGSTCACGTHPVFDVNGDVSNCLPLSCSMDCGDDCTNSLAIDGTTSDETDDVHHLGRHNKVCRYNNDASCHTCPTSSCQYPVGNFYGSGFPCKHLEGTQTFESLTFVATNANGQGLPVTLSSGYSDGQAETIQFCSTDEFELELLDCGVDKLPLIVSPKTCTHCQVARCVNIADAWRYLEWNSDEINALFNDDGEYIGTDKYQVALSTTHAKLGSAITIPAELFCSGGTGILGDNNNCVYCGNACTNGEVCFDNLYCTCESGELNDDNNCGSCGYKCHDYKTSCIASATGPTCDCLTGTLNDDDNCGMCGTICAADSYCNGGYCVPLEV